MGWGNQVNIVASRLLQGEHHGGQFLIPYLIALTPVSDQVILAEHTEQIAIRKKDGPRTPVTRDGRFLTKMGSMIGNHRLPTGLA
ncbi:MAG: hypothetical protein BWY80_01447 [Firmicutes bacterium ADurb.Bin456]|nr:MAG: hypothetical protein BWY80_01447 [Firmicutes bacterium ADurb.Bin456]